MSTVLQVWEGKAFQCLPPSHLLLLVLADVCKHAAATVRYASADVHASDACVAVGCVHGFVMCVQIQHNKLVCHHSAIALLLHTS